MFYFVLFMGDRGELPKFRFPQNVSFWMVIGLSFNFGRVIEIVFLRLGDRRISSDVMPPVCFIRSFVPTWSHRRPSRFWVVFCCVVAVLSLVFASCCCGYCCSTLFLGSKPLAAPFPLWFYPFRGSILSFSVVGLNYCGSVVSGSEYGRTCEVISTTNVTSTKKVRKLLTLVEPQ